MSRLGYGLGWEKAEPLYADDSAKGHEDRERYYPQRVDHGLPPKLKYLDKKPSGSQ